VLRLEASGADLSPAVQRAIDAVVQKKSTEQELEAAMMQFEQMEEIQEVKQQLNRASMAGMAEKIDFLA